MMLGGKCQRNPSVCSEGHVPSNSRSRVGGVVDGSLHLEMVERGLESVCVFQASTAAHSSQITALLPPTYITQLCPYPSSAHLRGV